jgi:predicted nucleotide-binding protein (sugar kinase/HSP70/actin superfamily)
MIAGDLVTSVESGTLRPDSAFVLPGTVVSCLLRQYGYRLDLILARLGTEPIRLTSRPLDSHPKLIGLPLTIRYAAVFAAADMLLRIRCRIRPYEQKPGQTDEVYHRSLEHLAVAAELGNLWDTLEQIATDFASIERCESPRPIVGVAGDIYTGIDDFASDGIFRSLEDAGCEVWPAPFGYEVAGYNATRPVQFAWRLRRPGWGIRFSILSRVFKRHRQRLNHIFNNIAGNRPELSIDAIQDRVRPYLGSPANYLLVPKVGRMLIYANAGADGILNAYCTNCMIGSVSEALHARLREDIRKLLMVNLVYGDGSGKVNQTRLLAFIHQVKQIYREKRTIHNSYI